jgi:Flp pilus assembly pilin Flp
VFAMSFLNLCGKVKQLAGREDGATMVEYTVMLAVVVAVLLSAIQMLGPAANKTFAKTSNAISVSDESGF